MSRDVFRVCEKRCGECLFTKNKLVDDKRRDEILDDCYKKGTHFICHRFSPVFGPQENVCCWGFYDEIGSASLVIRLAKMLGIVRFVPVKPVEVLTTPQDYSVDSSTK